MSNTILCDNEEGKKEKLMVNLKLFLNSTQNGVVTLSLLMLKKLEVALIMAFLAYSVFHIGLSQNLHLSFFTGLASTSQYCPHIPSEPVTEHIKGHTT